MPREDIRQLLEALEDQGFLHTDPQHGGVSLCQKARGVLFEGEKVYARLRKDAKLTAQSQQQKPGDPKLLNYLKQIRMELATREAVPPYVVFSNAVLEEMARRLPADQREFLEISGVGRYKAEKYGPAFLRAISAYRENPDGV